MVAHELSSWLSFLLCGEAIACGWVLLPDTNGLQSYMLLDLPWHHIDSSGHRVAEAACLNIVDTGADDAACVETRTLRDPITSIRGSVS